MRRRPAVTTVVVALLVTSAGWSTAAGSSTSGAATTSWPAICPGPPDSLANQVTASGAVRQADDGSFVGCFRTPDLRRRTLYVALEDYVALPSTPRATGPASSVSSSGADGHFSLRLSRTHLRPGQRVLVTATYLSGRRPPGATTVNLCWDGCLTGLVEQAVPERWTSPTRFSAVLTVPDAPWFAQRGGVPYVHPLVTGRYSIGVQCVTPASGCATRPADAVVRASLTAPRASWCTSRAPCGSMHLSATHVVVGDVVVVRGRAPLATFIGAPVLAWLALGTTAQGSTPVSFAPTAGAEDIAVVAPTRVSVSPGLTWDTSTLGRPVATSWSGASAVDAEPGSPLVAWCEPGRVVLTGGGTRSYPTRGVVAALSHSGYSILSQGTAPTCTEAIVNPADHRDVVVSVPVARRGEAPPIDGAGLYSTDGGTTWRLVPRQFVGGADFGGWSDVGGRVAALLLDPATGGSGAPVAGAPVRTLAPSRTWTAWRASTLGCPTQGPCVEFGPVSLDNCAMNPEPSDVLVGRVVGSSARFSQSRWVTAVDTCHPEELVATSTGDELLLNPSSPYPLLASDDGGRTWSYIQLPRLPGISASDGVDNTLAVLPTGSLLADVSPGGTSPPALFLLPAGARSWCAVPRVLPTAATVVVAPLRVSDRQLVWQQSAFTPAGQPGPPTRHVAPLARVAC